MVWTKKYADGDAKEDWFRDIGESEQWPSSAALTGMGLVDGQLVPMRDNADDSVLELLARPDPTLTNFIVGANSQAHNLVVALFDFLRTHDKDGGEIGRALAQMMDDERGDTTLSFVNMIDQQIYTNEQLLCMPFGGYENSDDCQWR